MRRVRVPALDRHVAALAFGCASLGSRVSPSAGRRAVHNALDAGVDWFDVAPPYGDGRAEELLGVSLEARRKDVVICTKFGIGRPSVSLTRRLVRPFAQQVVTRAPGLRSVLGRGRPGGERVAIAPENLEAWLLESLRRLRTDYIDVFAAHDPSLDEARDERLYAALEALRRKGVIRAISIAGAPEAAAASAKFNIDFIQFSASPFDDATQRLRGYRWVRPPQFITHGVFGSGRLERLRALEGVKKAALRDLVKLRGPPSGEFESDALMHFAFANNPDGIVIASMFSQTHIAHNAALADIEPDPHFNNRFLEIISGAVLNAG